MEGRNDTMGSRNEGVARMLISIPDLQIDWGPIGFWDLVLRLGSATILGGLVGLERERLERAAGLRTHALVSVASALIMVVSTYGFPAMVNGAVVGLDPSRMAAQVISGIGFLGAGVIIFRENTIRGLTTAATVWSVAGIGLATGGGLYMPAIVGTAFMLFIQAGLKPVERTFFGRHARQHRVTVEAVHGTDLLEEVQGALQGTPIRLRSLQFEHSPASGLDLAELTLMADQQRDILRLITRLRESGKIRRITYQRSSSIVQSRERLSDFSEEDEDNGNAFRL